MVIKKSKSAPSRPYRRSIWRHDDRYDIDPSSLSASEVATLCRLSSVDAAKKQVPPVPPKGIFDARYEGEKFTLFTSNNNPLKALLELSQGRILSRIKEMARIMELSGDDFRNKK